MVGNGEGQVAARVDRSGMKMKPGGVWSSRGRFGVGGAHSPEDERFPELHLLTLGVRVGLKAARGTRGGERVG